MLPSAGQTKGIEVGPDVERILVLALLEEERRTVLAENHERLKTVEDKIANLLAIEHAPPSK